MAKMNNIEIYENQNRELVLKQDNGTMDCDSEQIIVIHPDQVNTVVKWIRQVKSEIIDRINE